MFRRARLCLLMAFVILSAVPFSAQQAGQSPLRKKAEAMKKILGNMGFDVREGLFLPLDAGEWYCKGWLYSCNMNNAGAPYHIVFLPEVPGQADTGFPAAFRMRRDEAIVIVGPTPPECRYYSYSFFVYYRWDPAQRRVRKLFDTLGQPMNRFLLKTGGSDFAKNIVLTFTCDKRVDQEVREAAFKAGFPRDILNTYVVPSSGLKTNDALDDKSDSMIIVQRTALVTGPPNEENPIVLRVTPKSPTPADRLKPFPAPELRVRGTGKTEMDWIPAVDALREGILAKNPGRTPLEYTTVEFLEQSPIALQTWVNTLGDSSDTTYLGTRETFKLSGDSDDFLMVYGVNHTKTEKAIYANINVYTACALCGVATAFSDDYEDTARDYLSGPLPFDPSYLFAYKIARDCDGDPHCLKVPTSDVCGEGAALDDDLVLGFRAYLEPKTKTGPSYTELQYERVLHFTAPPPQVQNLGATFAMPFPGAIPVQLYATSQSPGALRWQADYEFLDTPCCGTLEPKEGTVEPGGRIDFAFTPNRAGTYYIAVTVTDERGRQTCGDVVVKSEAPPP